MTIEDVLRSRARDRAGCPDGRRGRAVRVLARHLRRRPRRARDLGGDARIVPRRDATGSTSRCTSSPAAARSRTATASSPNQAGRGDAVPGRLVRASGTFADRPQDVRDRQDPLARDRPARALARARPPGQAGLRRVAHVRGHAVHAGPRRARPASTWRSSARQPTTSSPIGRARASGRERSAPRAARRGRISRRGSMRSPSRASSTSVMRPSCPRTRDVRTPRSRQIVGQVGSSRGSSRGPRGRPLDHRGERPSRRSRTAPSGSSTSTRTPTRARRSSASSARTAPDVRLVRDGRVEGRVTSRWAPRILAGRGGVRMAA